MPPGHSEASAASSSATTLAPRGAPLFPKLERTTPARIAAIRPRDFCESQDRQFLAQTV
jgi:hypothetical protein